MESTVRWRAHTSCKPQTSNAGTASFSLNYEKGEANHPLRSEFLLRSLLPGTSPSLRLSLFILQIKQCTCRVWVLTLFQDWFINTPHHSKMLNHCLCSLLFHCYLSPFNKMSFWVKTITAKRSLPNSLGSNEITSSALFSRGSAWTRTPSYSSRKSPEYSSPWGPSPLVDSQNALFSLARW